MPNDTHHPQTTLTRRQFILSSALAASGSMTGLHAVTPFKRISPRIKGLSLAAYSFRRQLNWMKGKRTRGTMNLMDLLDFCAGQELEGVELTAYFFPEPLTSSFINQLKRRAHILGLDITGGAIGNNFSMTPGSDEAKKQEAYVTRWIDHYADLGAPVIRVFAGKSGPKGATEEQIIKNIHANLGDALVHAEKRGVMLAIENHDSMTNMDRLLTLVKSVDSDYLGITWDSGNLQAVADPYADLARIAPYALNAQIKVMIPVNGKREPADFAKLIGILNAAGYAGYAVLEYEEKEDPFVAVPRHLKALRKALG